jgi:uncharacterized membrane protein
MTQATSFSGRCRRFLKHVMTTSAAGRRAFPEATLKAIEEAIWRGEQIHGAEVRLIIEPALSIESLCKNVSNRQRALALFAQYGIWDTEENCGVLIYVNLAERHVDIVTDRNAGRKIEPGQWQAICTTMTQGFASGNYHDSTLAAIDTLNELLRKHFRPTNGRPNQLPDTPIIL